MTITADSFHYPGYAFDPISGQASFFYSLRGPDGDYEFREDLLLDPAEGRGWSTRAEQLTAVIQLLYVVAGVSYYKLAAPPQIVVDTPVLAEGAANYVTQIFGKGLGEFAYRNQLPHVLETNIVLETDADAITSIAPAESARPLIPIGGGKDSLVTITAFQQAGIEPVLFAVNPNRPITDMVQALGLELISARRIIDPQLRELNERGLNGHVPVTAINSLAAIAASLLHGVSPVVMSNEDSASSPNVEWNGQQINHQWSKSWEAEQGLIGALAAHAGLDDWYFSFLRPLSELAIVRKFAAIDDYDQVVTSCNAAYKLSGASQGWCGNCPKCRFISLIMAPFMSPQRLESIVGVNLLADLSQLEGFQDLVGLGQMKPFECVGDIDESLTAVAMLRQQPQWNQHPVVVALTELIPSEAWPDEQRQQQLMNPSSTHAIAARYQAVFDALI